MQLYQDVGSQTGRRIRGDNLVGQYCYLLSPSDCTGAPSLSHWLGIGVSGIRSRNTRKWSNETETDDRRTTGNDESKAVIQIRNGGDILVSDWWLFMHRHCGCCHSPQYAAVHFDRWKRTKEAILQLHKWHIIKLTLCQYLADYLIGEISQQIRSTPRKKVR